MSEEIIQISNAETLNALNRAEVDVQIETAKRYPMHSTTDQIANALAKTEMFALVDQKTAESCFYRLERNGKDGMTVIEGPSIRLAEIIANCWGNLRIQSIIAGNDGKTITARGVCHDLETNVAMAVDCKRSIVNKNGYTFSQDMQVVTGNAAAAIARRNAILSVIPEAIFKRSYEKIKSAVVGQIANNLTARRDNMLKTYAVAGISKEQIMEKVGVKSIDDITAEHVANLAATWNALRDGQQTIEEVFPKKKSSEADKAKEAAKSAKEKIAAAAAGAKAAAAAQVDTVDPETGEAVLL